MTVSFGNYLNNHPMNPCNAKEAWPTFGYICPNQFAHINEPIEGTDKQMDFEDARDIARILASRYSMIVAVQVSDDDGEEFETRKYAPKKI